MRTKHGAFSLWTLLGRTSAVALAAFGDGDGRTTDSKGALRALHERSYGQALLVIVAVGLFGYAVWVFEPAL